MWFKDILACPDCAAPLKDLTCEACGFESVETLPRDLRPKKPKAVSIGFERVPFAPETYLDQIPIDPPIERYTRVKAQRDSSELIGGMLKDIRPGARVLDLGCGPRDQAPVFESLGAQYVGVDFNGRSADILCDAHCLCFANESFDIVFSYAVLEHLANPFVAMAEITRVLRYGGVFCGTVSQGEPFHSSFFHHTSWGLISLARTSGLTLERVWPSSEDTLRSLATMGRYPKPIRTLLDILDCAHVKLPILSPRKHYNWNAAEKMLDRLHRAGSICFVFRRVGPSWERKDRN